MSIFACVAPATTDSVARSRRPAGPRSGDAKPPSQPQSRTTGGRHSSVAICVDSGWRRVRQNPCADDTDRVADPDRTSVTVQCPGRYLYQQSIERNDGALVGHVADQYLRHVDLQDQMPMIKQQSPATKKPSQTAPRRLRSFALIKRL